MGVVAEGLGDWIGSDVLDHDGEKVGKVSELHFHGDAAVIVEIAAGLMGRKRYLATLTGATVSRDHLRLASSELVATDGGVGAEELTQLAGRDAALGGVRADVLEGLSVREEHRRAAEEAAARAAALEAEAEQRRQDEREALAQADAAGSAAGDARAARLEAEAAARDARADADDPLQ